MASFIRVDNKHDLDGFKLFDFQRFLSPSLLPSQKFHRSKLSLVAKLFPEFILEKDLFNSHNKFISSTFIDVIKEDIDGVHIGDVQTALFGGVDSHIAEIDVIALPTVGQADVVVVLLIPHT